MMDSSRRRLCLGAATVAVGGAIPALLAPRAEAAVPRPAGYPDKPVNFILTVPAGGVTDVLFRKLADVLRPELGQPVVVQNRPGGGSLVALNYVRSQAPDGYTISMIGRSVLNQHWVKNEKLGFNPIDDLTWISRVNGSVFAIVVRADSPFRTWSDIVAAGKAKPDTLSYGGFASIGGMTHVPIVDAIGKDDLKIAYVPYKGDGEVLQSLMAGALDFAVMAGSFRGSVDTGRLRLIAMLTGQRVPRYPDVPTMIELGYPVTVEASVGIAGPKGMPPAIVAYLADAIRRAMTDPGFVETVESTLQMATYLDNAGFSGWARDQLAAERVIVDRFDLREK